MKVTLAQINTTPNDFEGNFKQIEFGIQKAIDDKSDLVVLPELAICGYSIQDLIYSDGFVQKNYHYLNQICELTKNNKQLYVVVGYVDKNNSGSGKPFFNSVAVINNGFIIGKYNKWLYPFYDVFDECRWYEPGKDLLVFNIGTTRCGIACCEDFWNDKGQDDYNHKLNPIQKYRELGVDWMISVNSSPFIENKPFNRIKMLGEVCSDSFGLIYVNQYGGNDSLVFDGHSFIMNKHGSLKAYLQNDLIPKESPFFKGALGQYKTVDTNFNGYVSHTEEDEVLKMILLGLFDYGVKSGFDKFVLGSSGGVDSALVISLACMAFGSIKVHAIMMPSIYSSEGSIKDAQQLHENWGCHEYKVPIEHESKLNFINDNLKIGHINKWGQISEENFQARLRGQIVMHFSNATGALALGTTNKTEQAVGYGTLFGDLSSCINILGDLYKLQIFAMCKRINEIYKKEMIPNVIINKPPSAELAPGQTDEKALMPYAVLDKVCKAYIEDYVHTIEDFKKWLNKNELTYDKDAEKILNERYDSMIARIDRFEFKRRLSAFCIKVSKKAFGNGRRIPICKGNG